MPSCRTNLTLWLLAFVPSVAMAHGEEVLLFPIGTLLAVAAILLTAFMQAVRWHVRVAACILAFAASIPFWLIPSDYIPEDMQHTGWGNFIMGFLPSLAVGWLVIWLFRGTSTGRSGA